MGVRGSTPDGPYIHRAGAAHVTFRLLSHRSGAIYPDPYGEVISEHPPAFRWGPAIAVSVDPPHRGTERPFLHHIGQPLCSDLL